MLNNRFVRRLLRRFDYMLQAVRAQDRQDKLYSRAVVDPTVKFDHAASIENNQTGLDAIRIGAHCLIFGQLLVYPYGGRIQLGSYVFLGPGSKIWSEAAVTVGNNVLISHNVNIHDGDTHPIDVKTRREQMQFIVGRGELTKTSFEVPSSPIHIGDDAWIGMNAVILKGVSIGEGAIVAAGSVVTRDVEAFTLVAGNPAVPKKRLTGTRDV